MGHTTILTHPITRTGQHWFCTKIGSLIIILARTRHSRSPQYRATLQQRNATKKVQHGEQDAVNKLSKAIDSLNAGGTPDNTLMVRTWYQSRAWSMQRLLRKQNNFQPNAGLKVYNFIHAVIWWCLMSVHSHAIMWKCLFTMNTAPWEGSIKCSPNSPAVAIDLSVDWLGVKLVRPDSNPVKIQIGLFNNKEYSKNGVIELIIRLCLLSWDEIFL